MRTILSGIAIFFAIASCSGRGEFVTEYRNAVWWDGNSERSGSLYVRDGIFVDPAGATPHAVIDLEGAIVTAPFGEGHNHNIVESIFQRSNAEYLRNGVFYVKVPATYPPAIERIRDELNRSDTVDAIFSMGGLTSPGGHPVGLFVNTLSKTIYGGATYEDFRGQAFHEVANESEVVKAIQSIAGHGADFVKALVLYSEDYFDDGYDGRPLRGLHPVLLPTVVNEAHKHSLPVTLHVNSAADFRAGVAAGVDEIAHLPGIAWPEDRTAEDHRLTAEDAAQAKDVNVAVVTSTYVIDVRFKDQPDRLSAFESVQRHNLSLLIAAGVEIRIGSDMYDRDGTGKGADPTRGEVESLVDLGVFDARSVLALWIETGRKIFPERRIACFEQGCEASFLVFTDDPRTDLVNLSSLTAGVKQGGLVTGVLEQ
jgi:hypothetical protein